MSLPPLVRKGNPWPALLVAAVLLAAACGGPEELEGGPGGASPEREAAGEPGRLEHLRSLGYVSWDEDADPSLAGVTVHDPGRAFQGYNLYTNDVDKVILADMELREVHVWRLPEGKRQCEYAELLPDEGVIVECVDQSVVYLGQDSQVIWDLAFPAHHDIARLDDGAFLVPYLENQRYAGRDVGFDGIARISRMGWPMKLWSTWDRLGELRRHHGPSPLDIPPGPGGDPLAGREEGLEYYHLNSINMIPVTPLGQRDGRFQAGNLLICLRNMNLIVLLDRVDLHVTWSWGERELELPHMPVMLPSGNILVFDNGTYRGWSRILEIEPPGGRIVWSYEGDPRESFFSKWRGGVQRLPNGNTLITESEKGRVFEVTPGGEVVWELWNPEIADGKRKRIYRMERLSPGQVSPRLLAPQDASQTPSR